MRIYSLFKIKHKFQSASPKAEMIQSSCDLLAILVDNASTRFDVTLVARYIHVN